MPNPRFKLKVIILLASLLAGWHHASAQMNSFAIAEGTVQVEDEAGNKKPAPAALVEAYRLDQGGHWWVRTDVSGHYAMNLPYLGVYLMVVSGEGLMPLWANHVQLKQTRLIDFVTYPGPGNRLSPVQIREMSGRSQKVEELYNKTLHYKVTLPPDQKAEYFHNLHDIQARAEAAADLRAESNLARDTYNIAVWWKIGGEYQRALDEFDKLLPYDGSKDEYFAKVARESIVNIAEIHYLWGIKLYDNGPADQAREHFQTAIEFGNRYIAWAEAAGPNLDDDYRTFLLTTYRIVARSALDLVKVGKTADFKTTALADADKAATMDPRHRSDWGLLKARVYSSSGDRDEAIKQYRILLRSDADNTDGLYEVSLLLLKSQSDQDLSDAAGYLRRFVKLAPPGDERAAAAKKALKSLESNGGSE